MCNVHTWKSSSSVIHFTIIFLIKLRYPDPSSLYIIICSIFTQEEVNEIRALKLSDIIKQVTSIAENDIQEDVFEWNTGDPCRQPLQLNASHLEHCPYLKGHDYFQVRKKMKKFSYIFCCQKKNSF